VHVDRVTVRLGGAIALCDISHDFPESQCCALVGPSGCGKSTLLRSIVGLIVPDQGMVRLGDQRVTPQSVTALRRRIGYVIQEGGLFPHLTARDNVTLMARHLNWRSDRIASRVSFLAELTQLTEDQLGRYPAELSGGQRQRVGIMRALMLDPEILLFDEPLGALDPMIRADLQQDLRQIFSSLKKTVILVTHDLAEAAFLADHIVLLRHGRIEQVGTLAELQRTPASDFVRDFVRAQSHLELGSPAR
jgi:osmoprotectant transport system ATP-binding protein